MTATMPGLTKPGLYTTNGWVTWVDGTGAMWVWAGDPIGTPGTRWGYRPVVDGRIPALDDRGDPLPSEWWNP